ncbi:MAG: hypothetical protein AAF449_12470 [Myxococcota bacterium]
MSGTTTERIEKRVKRIEVLLVVAFILGLVCGLATTRVTLIQSARRAELDSHDLQLSQHGEAICQLVEREEAYLRPMNESIAAIQRLLADEARIDSLPQTLSNLEQRLRSIEVNIQREGVQ